LLYKTKAMKHIVKGAVLALILLGTYMALAAVAVYF
jgi:hypothetical protein